MPYLHVYISSYYGDFQIRNHGYIKNSQLMVCMLFGKMMGSVTDRCHQMRATDESHKQKQMRALKSCRGLTHAWSITERVQKIRIYTMHSYTHIHRATNKFTKLHDVTSD